MPNPKKPDRKKGSVAMRLNRAKAQGWRCYWCGREMSPSDGTQPIPNGTCTLDRKIPTDLGGTDDFTNRVAACHGCNKAGANRKHFLENHMLRHFQPATVDAIKAIGGCVIDAHSEARREFLLGCLQPGDCLAASYHDGSTLVADITAPEDFAYFRSRCRNGLATFLAWYSVPKDNEGWAARRHAELEGSVK